MVILHCITEVTVHSKYYDVNFKNIRNNVNRRAVNSFERSKILCLYLGFVRKCIYLMKKSPLL